MTLGKLIHLKKTRSRKSRDTVHLTLFAFSSPSLPIFFLFQVSFLLLLWQTFSTDSSFPFSFPAREARERWPLHIAEIESNGDSKSTNERSPSLVGSNGDLFSIYWRPFPFFTKYLHILYSVQSSVWRLPNYWPPPLSTQRVCPPPAPKAGGTNSPGGEGVGKTPDNGLAQKNPSTPFSVFAIVREYKGCGNTKHRG